MNAEQRQPEEIKGLSSGGADEQIRQQAIQREELQKWAADRVKTWQCELRIDDYDFRSWASDESKKCLVAGHVYEYARESRKLRGLLVLMNPKRERKSWEMVRPALVNGKEPDPNDPLAQARPLSCSFEDLDEHEAERALGGFLYCLADLADYLANNISFGELFRTKREELETAFGGLESLERVGRAHRHFYPVDGVTWAWEAEVEQATVCETVVDDPPREGELGRRQRTIRNDGSEIVTLRIRWGSHTNADIGAAMERFARTNRPTNETCKEPQRKGRGRVDTLLSALDNLSAMRLIRWCPIGEAIRLFGGVRLNARGGAPEQRKVRDQKAEAESDFRRDFPFGEDPANCGTFALSS
jgi:hypothetical protein